MESRVKSYKVQQADTVSGEHVKRKKTNKNLYIHVYIYTDNNIKRKIESLSTFIS